MGKQKKERIGFRSLANALGFAAFDYNAEVAEVLSV
jgi:hypothetical protein